MRSKLFSIFALLISVATLASCDSNEQITASSTSPITQSGSTTSITTIPTTTTTPTIPEQEKTYTIAELIALMPADGSTSEERYLVRATIKSIDNPSYGMMTIEDDTGTLMVYGTWDSKGEKRYPELEDKPIAGDEVLLYGNLKMYKDTPEIYSGWIMEVKHNEQPFDESKYTESSIAQAREASEGALVKVTGIVSTITYANGHIPNGFMLIGDSSSIYVYDTQIASQVNEGNLVTLFGKKDYFVLDSEKTNAAKYGYNGACQLTEIHLGSNDKKENAIDWSFAQEKTVKEVMDTPYSSNITSAVYHSNALIKKVEGKGFTNYYIDDLDEKTGSYVYTMNNGSDFAWLDSFDGKVCSVYYTPLNAKSTASGCNWRFLPLKVEDKNYTFNKAEAPKFAVEYYGVEQFLNTYYLDPQKKMVTSVVSNLLNFGTATLSYQSSNTDVAFFETTADKNVLFHTKNPGTSEITITGHLDGQQDYSTKVTVTVKETPSISSISVKEAIDSKIGTSLNVKGVIGPSLVNKNGFYLIDDSGVLAVQLNAGQFDGLAIGQTVIVSGLRDLNTKDETFTYGEQFLSNATIALNYYGDTAPLRAMSP